MEEYLMQMRGILLDLSGDVETGRKSVHIIQLSTLQQKFESWARRMHREAP